MGVIADTTAQSTTGVFREGGAAGLLALPLWLLLAVCWTVAPLATVWAQEIKAQGKPQDAVKTQTASPTPETESQATFAVKYIAEGAIYLNGGTRAGIMKGQKLAIRRSGTPPEGIPVDAAGNWVVAQLVVVAAAPTSAVCEVKSASSEIKKGDLAYLSVKVADAPQRREGSSSRVYPQVITFSEGDPRDEDVRNLAPGVQSAEIDRFRGRIGLDYGGTSSTGPTSATSSQLSLIVDSQMTRIAGTYWNLNGYWRRRVTDRTQSQGDPLHDVLNKTFTMELNYTNPDSKWVAGFGRLYLPWAISLDTVDGGYAGRKFGHGATAGIFAGSTPDPASWSYSPDRRMGGAFVNFEGGSFDTFHYTSTVGAGMNAIKFKLDRPFVFLENEIYYKRLVSVYLSITADSPQGVTTNGFKPGAGISRSYFSVHMQLHRRVSLDVIHNRFRDVPTAAVQLIGTGLVDKLLYQGASASMRVEVKRHVYVYTTLGQSARSGDARINYNQMYGVTWDQIGSSKVRADVHYAKFDSSFARGDYRSVSLSRYVGDRMRLEVLAGHQNLTSALTSNNTSQFFNTSFDVNVGRHAFVQSGFTVEHGAQLNYNQWFATTGYRFDSKTMRGAAK